MPECPICLGNVDDPCVAPCSHVYCCHCIVQVLLSRPPEWAGSCPLCRTHISVYNLRNNGQLLVEPEVQNLWGCVFVQYGKLGLASYHFNSLEDCYISYDAAPETWRLDDGCRPPSKKPWEEVSYDPESRIFRGVIRWDPPFRGNSKWVYRMEFSEDFAGITGGEVVCSGGSEATTQSYLAPWIHDWERHLSYLRWTPPPATMFGSVFVQGTSYSSVLEGVASYHFDSPERCYISYANAPESWLLDDGSKPPRQKNFELMSYEPSSRTFKGTIRWPQGFDGAVRWVYTIVFSEDFEQISDGKVQPYGSRGCPMAGQHFGNPSGPLQLSASVMYYVRKPSALAASARIQQRFLASHNVENETNEPDAVEGSGPGNPTDIVARPQTQGACAMQ